MTDPKDFFISYNKADRAWAEWIAWQLEFVGYTTVLQAWDFRPSQNSMSQMDDASETSDRVLCVLSEDYFDDKARYSALERHVALRP